jgi:hypothetical protein
MNFNGKRNHIGKLGGKNCVAHESKNGLPTLNLIENSKYLCCGIYMPTTTIWNSERLEIGSPK